MLRVFTLLFFISCVAHSQALVSNHLHMEGNIGKNTVSMFLDIHDNDSINGGYFYNHNKKYVKLKGVITKDKQINLTEITESTSFKDSVSGFLTGKLVYGKFNGYHENTEKTSKVKFNLPIKNTFQKKDSSGYTVYFYNQYLQFFPDTDITGISVYEHILLPNSNKRLQKLIADTIFSDPLLSIDEKIQKDIDDKVFDYFEDLSQEEKDLIIDAPGMSYYSYRKYIDKSFENKDFLIMKVFNLNYTGGAHDLFYYRYYVFDKKHFKQLTLNDIFYKSDTAKIRNLIIKKLNEQMDFEKIYNTNRVFISDNFFFDNKNFYFVYNIYEIAAFSGGEIIVKIPYREIKNYFIPLFNYPER